MSKVVFWDASAFVALGNKKDYLHEAAVAVSQQLAQENARLLTTDAILIEIANGLSAIRLRGMAQQLIASIRQSEAMGAVEVVHIDKLLWERGWQLYQQRPDKEWGLTDCLSFVVMQDKQVVEAFTADHHFAQAGFVCLL